MTDFLRYILFRTETWTITGALFMVCIYAATALDSSRAGDSISLAIGTMLAGMFGAGVTGGLCALLWQTVRVMTGRHVPIAPPTLLQALLAASPGMRKGAIIGGAVFYLLGLIMTGLFVLTNEKTGMLFGSRIAWQVGVGIAGAGLGAGIASIGGLTRLVVAR